MERFVYRQHYANLLISMATKSSKIDELAKSINANSGQLRIVLQQWSKEGIILMNRPGREYDVELTPYGQAISQKLAELLDTVKNYKAPKENETNGNAESSTVQSRPRKTSKTV